MRHITRRVAACPQRLGKRGKFRGNIFRKTLSRAAWTKPFRVRHYPFQFLKDVGIAQILQGELVLLADRVRPVGPDHKPVQIADNKKRRVFQREGILLNVRRQIIWRSLGLGLAEYRPRLWVDVMRRACGAASADAGWFVV